MATGWRTLSGGRALRASRMLVIALGGTAALWLAIGWADARGRAVPECRGSGSVSYAYGGGGRLLSDMSVPVCETGAVEVSFSGDRPSGHYVGAQLWRPEGGGDLDVTTSRIRGRRSVRASLFLGGTVQAAVQRAEPTGRTAACSDRGGNEVGGFLSPAVRGGRLHLSLAGAGAALFGTRCAGPLDADVAAALPAASVALRQITRGGVIDLRGTRPFAAHGFSGEVRSTLVLRLGRAKTTHRPNQPSSGAGHGRRIRDITVAYRVERLRGSAVADVHAVADPAECGPLDACGLSGSLTVAPGPTRGGTMYLTASAPATRPRRDLLAALGLSADGNPAGIGVFGGGETRGRGTVTADLRQNGACRDQTRVNGAAIALQSHAGRLLASLSPLGSQVADPLRTRCPGPDLGQHMLTRSTLARAALGRRVLTIALHGGAFADGPYRVRARSTLVLTLRRMGVSTQIFREPSPPGA